MCVHVSVCVLCLYLFIVAVHECRYWCMCVCVNGFLCLCMLMCDCVEVCVCVDVCMCICVSTCLCYCVPVYMLVCEGVCAPAPDAGVRQE